MDNFIRINEFREYQDEFWGIYNSVEKELLDFSKEYIPLSGFLLVTMLRRLSGIQSAIFDLCESKNYYSLNILYRAFIEHYLKFLYSFFRLAEEKKDDVGKDYYADGMMYESQLISRSEANAKKLSGEDKLKQKCTKNLQDKFKLKEIIKYINIKVPAKNHNSLPLSLIPIYSQLSSFVHCGVIADIDDLHSNGSNVKFKEISEVSFLMLISAFLYTFAAFDGLHRHFKKEINKTFAEQNQKMSNLYYEIQSKLNKEDCE